MIRSCKNQAAQPLKMAKNLKLQIKPSLPVNLHIAGWIPDWATFLQLDMVLKIFLWSFTCFPWFKDLGICQLMAKELALVTDKIHYLRYVMSCICENKGADQLLSKSEISSPYHFLWLYSLLCIGPRRKP